MPWSAQQPESDWLTADAMQGRVSAKMAHLIGRNVELRVNTAMAETIQTPREQMEAAAKALDFEEAKRLRDRINLMRGGATATEAEQADVSGLQRQSPGAMGLGTSQQRVEPPVGWKPPPKPDPLTRRRTPRHR